MGASWIIRPFGVLVLLFALLSPPALGAERVLFETDSVYYHITVYEKDGMRYLKCNRQVQGAVKVGDPLYIEYAYVRGMISTIAFMDSFHEILVVGLGSGSLPSYLRAYYPDAAIDIVELDPAVVDVAKSFFSFSEGPGTRITIEDGRTYLKKSRKRYDIIFLDAYVADTIPFHLTTQEFLSLARSRLRPGGIVVSNIWAPALNRFYDAEAKTYQAVFSEVYFFRPGQGSFVFIGSAQKGQALKETLQKRAEKITRQKGLNLDIAQIVGSAYSYDTHAKISARVLTDDFAPVGILQHQRSK